MRSWFPQALLLAALGAAGSCSGEPGGPSTHGPWVQVVAGESHTCALSPTARVYCWGRNDRGQLGDESPTRQTTPLLTNLTYAMHGLAAGGGHSCAFGQTGYAYCWGSNEDGQLGSGLAGGNSGSPVIVGRYLSFGSLTAGASHSCGVTLAGTPLCWGDNQYGQLGDGSTTDHPTPSHAAAGLTFQSVSAGANSTCGVTGAGAAYCWGTSGYGDLIGTGYLGGYAPSPLAVVGGLTFRSLAAGGAYTCGLTDSGAAYCWGGYGTEYAMGRKGPQVNVTSPVEVIAP